MITNPFPEPTTLIQHALSQLHLAAIDDTVSDDPSLPRPWDPASCPPTLRREVWYWLDDVAAWINTDHNWQPDHAVPGCWPAHPHIANELAVVACQRLAAGRALAPDRLDDWHRHTLPQFLDRMTNELHMGCPPGKHRDWPAASRHRQYTTADAVDRRRKAFAVDTDGRSE